MLQAGQRTPTRAAACAEMWGLLADSRKSLKGRNTAKEKLSEDKRGRQRFLAEPELIPLPAEKRPPQTADFQLLSPNRA